MCLMSYANNKGADQPPHPRSLISAFVIRCLDSVMSLVSVTKISSLMLASVAEQASLSLTWSETPEDTFSHDKAHITVWSESALFAIWIHYSLVNQNSANFRTIVTYFRVSEFFPFLWYAICNSNCIWAMTRQNVSSGVSDQARHKPACAATEAS